MMTLMSSPLFPSHRPRRLRRGPVIRDAVADISLAPKHLIYPLFVSTAESARPVASMPGVEQLPTAEAVETIRRLAARGLTQFILFGVTPASHKNATGSYASDPEAP